MRNVDFDTEGRMQVTIKNLRQLNDFYGIFLIQNETFKDFSGPVDAVFHSKINSNRFAKMSVTQRSKTSFYVHAIKLMLIFKTKINRRRRRARIKCTQGFFFFFQKALWKKVGNYELK